jgi:hypothetical protein
LVLGGSEILVAKFKLGKIFTCPAIKVLSLHMQHWYRELDLRKGLLSGLWQDITALVSSGEADVFGSDGALDQ